MFRLVLIAALIAVAVAGGCDNDCSGHGTCLQNGVCACYDNWGMGIGLDSGDCSQRICPFEFAWVDKPDKLGNHHKYAECSNRGICDRDSGECECFPGYEGKGCARTSCPNDCSGHGRCRFIEDLPFQITPHQFDTNSFFPQKAHTFGDAYKNWDAGRTRGCHCDPEWGDVDCSKRMCQHGNDIMDQRQDLTIAQKLHVQHIQFVSDWHVPAFFTSAGVAVNDATHDGRDGFRYGGNGNGRTFALTFTSKLNETFTTIPIRMPDTDGWANMKQFFVEVEHALEALPNGVIDNVKVNGELRVSPWISGTGLPSVWNQGYLDGDISSTSTNTMSGCGDSQTYDLVLLVSETGVGYGAQATLVSDANGGIASLTISTAGKGYVAGDIVSVSAAVLDGSGAVVSDGGTNSKVTFVLTSAQITPGLASDPGAGTNDASAVIDTTGALDGGEADHDSLYINITFQGSNVQGPQNLLTVKHIACADGCTPKLDGLDLRYNTMNVTELVDADYNSYECGRRGKCDYGSGICSCFNGYSGLSCGTITSLV